ncbi:hypothetical protein B0H10DRAFT_2184798 [Mycena sp. CBHHK59/15]|nr:hypothetical protein B0H10DRAFT_2184798 [Mycena sp. CBHHK59/15]
MTLSNITALLPRSGSTDIADSKYGYIPSEKIAIMFLALFGVILHIGQTIYFRLWWLLPTACLCGIGELVGWSGCLWSSFYPSLDDPYMTQITTTTIAPTPLIAMSFILLGRIVERLGSCYSRITPKWYSIIFCSCDFVALVVQGLSGGMTASADDEAGSDLFVAIIAYTASAVDFLRRYNKDLLVREILTMAKAASIYRIIELSTGWNGVVIETEVYFNVLDGGMVVLSIYTINIAHPGLLLGSARSAQRYSLAMQKLRTESPSSVKLENAEFGQHSSKRAASVTAYFPATTRCTASAPWPQLGVGDLEVSLAASVPIQQCTAAEIRLAAQGQRLRQFRKQKAYLWQFGQGNNFVQNLNDCRV